LEFGNVGFGGGGQRTNNELNPHMTPGPGIEHVPQWWQASVFTAIPAALS